jgi:hypothetical protein
MENSMTAGKPEPVSVSELIYQFTVNLAERSQVIAKTMDAKLSPVLRSQNPPGPLVNDPTVGEREYPPFFHAMRLELNIIQEAFNILEDILGRTEL